MGYVSFPEGTLPHHGSEQLAFKYLAIFHFHDCQRKSKHEWEMGEMKKTHFVTLPK